MTRPAWADETVDHALQLAAWRCREELRSLSGDLLEFDRVDLCVHRWSQRPHIDLQNPGRSMRPSWQCRRCDFMPPRSNGLQEAELPKFGRGRFGRP